MSKDEIEYAELKSRYEELCAEVAGRGLSAAELRRRYLNLLADPVGFSETKPPTNFLDSIFGGAP